MLNPFYNLPTPYIIYIDFPPLILPIMAISAHRRLTNKSWLLTEPHASHAMRATRRFPFVQAKNNKQVKLSITGTDNNTYTKECCRIGLARDRIYRVCTLSLPLNWASMNGTCSSRWLPNRENQVHSQEVRVGWGRAERLCFQYILLPHVNYHATNSSRSIIQGEKMASSATPQWPASPHPKNQARRPYKASTKVWNVVKLHSPVVHRYIFICNAMFRWQNIIPNVTQKHPVPTSASKPVLSDVLWHSSLSPNKF